MKRYNGLWEPMLTWENFLLAANKARRNKRNRPAVQRFEFSRETELVRLINELKTGQYRPGEFHSHWISQPKKRMISAAPYRDRVVHHALMNVLEPILERHFHPDSYACRSGKGTHAAVERLQLLMRRHKYVLQCDIRKYFPSIDHEILKTIFRRLIKDKKLLCLMDLIVDCSNEQEDVIEWYGEDELWTPTVRKHGIPIGNLTSQWFANWMLNGLDHHVTSKLGYGAYVRYCDDFLILGDDKSELWNVATDIQSYLSLHRLRLHDRKLAVRPVTAGVRFVGYRVWQSHRVICKKNVRQFRRRVRWMQGEYSRGRLELEDIKQRLAGWMGHARQANSWKLLERLSKEWVFERGGTI